jgi:Uncharacterized conserved protein
MPRIYSNSVKSSFLPFFLTLGAKINCLEETGMKRNSRDDLRALLLRLVDGSRSLVSVLFVLSEHMPRCDLYYTKHLPDGVSRI